MRSGSRLSVQIILVLLALTWRLQAQTAAGTNGAQLQGPAKGNSTAPIGQVDLRRGSTVRPQDDSAESPEKASPASAKKRARQRRGKVKKRSSRGSERKPQRRRSKRKRLSSGIQTWLQWFLGWLAFVAGLGLGYGANVGLRSYRVYQLLRREQRHIEQLRSAEREILEQACALMTPATVLLEIPDRVLHVRFQRLTGDGLDLRLDKPLPRSTLKRGVQACIQLVTPQRAYLFLCRVHGFHIQDRKVEGLRVTIPDNVAQADSRRFVRYRIPLEVALQARFVVGNSSVEVLPLDISMGGILVESSLDLKLGTEVTIQLELGEFHLESPVAVRRISGSNLGLSFGTQDSPLNTTPREVLAKIVHAIEAISLQSNASNPTK